MRINLGDRRAALPSCCESIRFFRRGSSCGSSSSCIFSMEEGWRNRLCNVKTPAWQVFQNFKSWQDHLGRSHRGAEVIRDRPALRGSTHRWRVPPASVGTCGLGNQGNQPLGRAFRRRFYKAPVIGANWREVAVGVIHRKRALQAI